MGQLQSSIAAAVQFPSRICQSGAAQDQEGLHVEQVAADARDPGEELVYARNLKDFATTCRPEMATDDALAWLSRIIELLWPEMDKVAQTIVEEMVEPRIQEKAESVSSQLKDMRFSQFTLGTSRPKITGLQVASTVFGGSKVQMFVEYESNMRVELTAMSMTVGMQSFVLRGEAAILMRPVIEGMPGKVGGVTMYFVNTPRMDLDFTGLANVADMFGISKIVREVITGVLKDKLVLPNAVTQLVGLRDMMVYPIVMGPPHPPIGALRVRLVKAQGLKDGDWHLNPLAKKIEDNYIRFRLADKTWDAPIVKLGKETLETSFPVFNVMQRLHIEVWDEDKYTADDFLGSAGAYIMSEAQALTGKEITVFDPKGKETNLGVLGVEVQFLVSKRFQLGTEMALIVVQTQEVILPRLPEGRIAVRAQLKGCKSSDGEKTTNLGTPMRSPVKEKAVKSVLEDLQKRLKSEGVQEQIIERVTAAEGLKATDGPAKVALNYNLNFMLPTEELRSAVLEVSVVQVVRKSKKEVKEDILGTCQRELGLFVQKPQEPVTEKLKIVGKDGMEITVHASSYVCALEPSEVPKGGKLDHTEKVAETRDMTAT